jgi:SAM-dependent methyltransferase
MAEAAVPGAALVNGNALMLPYADASFDACVTHFFLLWVDAAGCLLEMRRVTRPGGVILAFAEPDYGARVDYPPELAEVGRLQTESLLQQGADVTLGRRLPELFKLAGLINVFSGVLGGEWTHVPDRRARELEWAVVKSDLAGLIDPARLEELHRIDSAAWRNGSRVLYIPTYYAVGW